MATVSAARVAAARHWFTTRGHRVERVAGLASFVVDPARPEHWDANHAGLVETDDADALLAALDARMGHTEWRVVRTDATTPPAIEAALVLADFVVYSTLIQMVAPALAPGPATIATRPVATPADWATLEQLVRADAEEGGDAHEALPGAVIDAVVASYMRACPPVTFHLIEVAGRAVGYGCTVLTPQGLGVVEHLYVVPAERGCGLMSAFVRDRGAALFATGATALLLDARAEERPRRLYARLGFRPVMLMRTWIRQR